MRTEHVSRVHSSELIANRFGGGHAPAILELLPSIDLFIVKYKYGQLVAGPASDAERYSRLLTPCPTSDLCEGCKELLAANGHHRSLGFVIRGAIEEQLSLEQRTGWQQYVRRIPVNIAEQGEFLHITETVNALITPNYGNRGRRTFAKAHRRTTAGVSTVFFTAPFGGTPLAKHTRMKVGSEELREKYFQDRAFLERAEGVLPRTREATRWPLDERHSEFAAMLSEAVRNEWEAEVLFFPTDSLLRAMAQEPARWELWKSALFEVGWNAMRGSHSDLIRRAALEEVIGHTEFDLQVKTVVHYILGICRGEQYGLAPLRASDDIGPFRQIREFLAVNAFGQNGMKYFPAMLRPVKLKADRPVYFSFQNPLMVDSWSSDMGDLARLRAVDASLKAVRTNAPALLQGASWIPFQAAGGNADRNILKFRDQHSLAPGVESDFKDEFEEGMRLWNIQHPVQLHPGGIKGAMSRFIRFALPKQ